MNKIKNNFYNTIFWISRAITLSVFGIFCFALLNAKYIWSETFFPFVVNNFFNIFKNIINTFFLFGEGRSYLKNFILYPFNIEKIYVILVLNVLYYIVYFFIIKNTKKFVLNSIFLCFSYIVINIILFSNQMIYINFFIIISLLMLLLIVLNFKIKQCNLLNLILLIPIFSDLFLVAHILTRIKKSISNSKKIFAVFVVFNINLIIFLPFYFYNNKTENLILTGNFYSIVNDKTNKKTIFYELKNKKLYIVDDITDKFSNYTVDIVSENNESLLLNNNELYLYDEMTGEILILDNTSFEIKNKIFVTDNNGDEASGNAIIIDNVNNNIVLILEKGEIFIIKDGNDKIINKKIPDRYDNIIYNPFRNSYFITYWFDKNYFQEISALNYDIKTFTTYNMQGYAAISLQRKELYVAFHQRGRIYVFDAETMKLKRKIKTNYTVKDITYDEDLNVLIATSYYSGYIDIFFMGDQDILLTKLFVGYELRGAKFDSNKENLYVCSINGLYKIPININKLIEKYKNVSHETFN